MGAVAHLLGLRNRFELGRLLRADRGPPLRRLGGGVSGLSGVESGSGDSSYRNSVSRLVGDRRHHGLAGVTFVAQHWRCGQSISEATAYARDKEFAFSARAHVR